MTFVPVLKLNKMKKITLKKTIGIVGILLLGINYYSKGQFINTSADSNFYDIEANFLKLNLPADTVESGLYNQYKRFEAFWKGRVYPHGNFNIAAKAYR